MWLFRETLVTIAAFCTCVLAMDIRTFTKDWTISRKNFEFVYIGDIARLDNKFAYGVCKKSEFYAHLDCDIKLETLTQSSSDGTNICHIKFSTKHKQQDVRALIIQLELFGNDKILITELNVDRKNSNVISSYMKYSIVDMIKCSKKEVILSYGKYDDLTKNGVIMYNETFDIIMADEELCGSADMCRVTFDQWGKRIAGPISFPLNQKDLKIFYVKYSSPIQSFYVVSYNYGRDGLLVTRLGLDSTVTSLMTIEHPDHYVKHKVSSNNYNSFSTCWSMPLDNKEVHCVQFAARDDAARLNVTVPVAESTLPLAVYNLREGLLLVTIKSNQNQCNSFEVTKIFTNGHKSSFVIDELDLHCNNEFYINADVKANGKEICFNFVSEGPVYEGEKFITRSMQYRSKCVSKRDITKL